ncbi:pectin lyase superfamily protein [Arabidopsis thaliana]|uniref:Pectin lyase superfamily protein n=1 Tax=Arabidopsis thaliana TaxID=3702 RepID=A0A1P8B659_ARATH|nr:pectin lyase superfamily protein [Arabidopsis thaliana]ANM67079.1 pectin lyase superfamily protein [Arabidopsis thaliana]|eukprot:NP_001328931.1 pectin lyase superfamily protein [Arabidopsis thaliana]
MGFEILLSVLLIASYHLQYGNGRMILTMKDFISNSNSTNVDHSQAFQNAWRALCGGKGGSASFVIQAHETYTIQPQLLEGPCMPRNIHIQIDGTIEAPKMANDWGRNKLDCWLCFEKVTGLVLTGSGVLNTHGESWWSSVALQSRPVAVRFFGCQNILYNGLTQINSPRNHITILDSNNATLSNLHLIAPASSPNTDGIDISHSQNINIMSSTIKTGDDCVAIKRNSYNINVTYVTCGPGHGISIGSLGEGGASEVVQNVNVRHCTFTGTQNGARIKTWPATAVKVSDVTFRSFTGTCAAPIAIKLDCDPNTGCDNIVMEQINIASSSPKTPLTSYCKFAHVVSRFVSIPITCSFHTEDSQPASLNPQPSAPYAISPTTPHTQPHAPTTQPPLFFRFYTNFKAFLGRLGRNC